MLLAGVLAVGGGCGGGRPAAAPAATAPAPFADCADLTTATPPSAGPPSAGTPDAGVSGPAAGSPVPGVELACLAGGPAVATAALAGPAVVNLWATWCPPCRAELPLLQRYADRHRGVRVVGVVTEDDPALAADLGREAGIRFPQLVDRAGALKRAVGAPGLPVTLFVGPGGTLRYLHRAPLTDATLPALAATHLGAGG
ncbi:hypothetical protein GCM10010123_28920 [Pilimelia anulata]|uniref:Thioredoxin domain-containing protein n=1 Tax=Pilimelia anulata TaxID=53371 RepID=A0A8J3B6G3_9ACTN|nr:hypothetical protein GCM10010123_28920 [Pilimelia anulata]